MALAAPVAAQDQVKPPETEQEMEKTAPGMTEETAPTEEGAPAMTEETPPTEEGAPAMTEETPPAEAAGQQMAEEPTPPADMKFIQVQEEAQFLANSEVIGQSVVNVK
ncbi:MAG: hypothetical protein ACREH3_11940, partial [Geminicoccales bacterium]